MSVGATILKRDPVGRTWTDYFMELGYISSVSAKAFAWPRFNTPGSCSHRLHRAVINAVNILKSYGVGYLMTLSVSRLCSRIVRYMSYNELEKIWKESVVS
jgi:hypothetical protein